ncbi:MAG: Aspartokinase [Firmicutes bacterium ADurb.Bin193]|nr:MAG: Aspartokinase [Firmicutes bacterium ADurb.Bin193]
MGSFSLSSASEVALVTLTNIPNTAAVLADIFGEIGAAKINVDMICQTVPYKDKINLSFTINESDLQKTLEVVGGLKERYKGIVTEVSAGNCKFMIYSELLKTQWGVAARLFSALAQNGLEIKLITTSDTEISVLLDSVSFDKATAVLKKEFIEE